MRSDPILVTFTPSPGILDFLLTIPLVNDDIEEDSEGFFVVVVEENITNVSVPHHSSQGWSDSGNN